MALAVCRTEMSNTSETVAYPCLQADDELATLIKEDLPTMVSGGEAPSLISIPAWPPKRPKVPTPKTPRRVADAFPVRSATSVPGPPAFGQAPHELSPFGRSSQRLLASRSALFAAYALLGGSAFWAAWSVSRFL